MGNLIILGAILWLIMREQSAEPAQPIQPTIASESPKPAIMQPISPAIVQTGGSAVFDWSSIPDFNPVWIPEEEPPFLVEAPFECLSYGGMIAPYPECNPYWQNLPEDRLSISEHFDE